MAVASSFGYQDETSTLEDEVLTFICDEGYTPEENRELCEQFSSHGWDAWGIGYSQARAIFGEWEEDIWQMAAPYIEENWTAYSFAGFLENIVGRAYEMIAYQLSENLDAWTDDTDNEPTFGQAFWQ